MLKISKSKTFDRKKIFFLELTIFFVNSFDAEKADLSIGGIFRAIRALQRDRPGKNFQNLCILPSIHVYTIASSYYYVYRYRNSYIWRSGKKSHTYGFLKIPIYGLYIGFFFRTFSKL